MRNTTPSRYPSRATEDKKELYATIDAGLYCTIAFMRDGTAHQIPTGFCRVEDELFIHASSKSGFMHAIIDQEVSFSVTHMDALVLAPTAFDSSFNYRSAIGYGKAEEITDPEEKLKFFKIFTDRYIPGRIADIGDPTPEQVSITKIVRIPLNNASVKRRSGDVNMKMKGESKWCGIIPVETSYQEPQKDEQLPDSLVTPLYISKLVHGS
ncbi:MAG: pyridoxamine 5'-phosphate oxidase family protein [Cyclobacteriaceae bacterium]